VKTGGSSQTRFITPSTHLSDSRERDREQNSTALLLLSVNRHQPAISYTSDPTFPLGISCKQIVTRVNRLLQPVQPTERPHSQKPLSPIRRERRSASLRFNLIIHTRQRSGVIFSSQPIIPISVKLPPEILLITLSYTLGREVA